MTPIYLFKSIVVAIVLGYLALSESEARVLTEQDLINQVTKQVDKSDIPQLLETAKRLELSDEDEDDDDDDMHNLLNGNSPQQQNRQIVGQPTNQQYQALPITDLKTSASHHHHGHHAKGWLDMGAWTGKKGAFGWYDKHPVGKGK